VNIKLAPEGTHSSYDFDDCTSRITDYRDRWNVQHCELVDREESRRADDDRERRELGRRVSQECEPGVATNAPCSHVRSPKSASSRSAL